MNNTCVGEVTAAQSEPAQTNGFLATPRGEGEFNGEKLKGGAAPSERNSVLASLQRRNRESGLTVYLWRPMRRAEQFHLWQLRRLSSLWTNVPSDV